MSKSITALEITKGMMIAKPGLEPTTIASVLLTPDNQVVIQDIVGTKYVYGASEHLIQHDYNGWTNYVTWNIALWINNSPTFYRMAQVSKNYAEFLTYLDNPGYGKTPDGVLWADRLADVDSINQLIQSITT